MLLAPYATDSWKTSQASLTVWATSSGREIGGSWALAVSKTTVRAVVSTTATARGPKVKFFPWKAATTVLLPVLERKATLPYVWASTAPPPLEAPLKQAWLSVLTPCSFKLSVHCWLLCCASPSSLQSQIFSMPPPPLSRHREQVPERPLAWHGPFISLCKWVPFTIHRCVLADALHSLRTTGFTDAASRHNADPLKFVLIMPP
mmetsp:Transcript_10966/g.27634  ORF Transcript_10966/g.27634 Transcript_10966/m.27634 type:complete len:204 (-) Transcript_10966:553-1164(-)